MLPPGADVAIETGKVLAGDRRQVAVKVLPVRGACDIGVVEIAALEQQRLNFGLRKGVGETIAEVQLCRVAASFAEIAVGFTRGPGLRLRNRLNQKFGLSNQIVESATGDWIATCVNNDRGFEEISGGDPANGRNLKSVSASQAFRFIAQNRQESRRVHDHFGNPRSS